MTFLRPSDVQAAAGARGRRAFTLVELLAVIAIIGIMIAVMIPLFSGMGKGSKMTAAVTQLKTTMSLARQHAITKREMTYVVFPDDDSSHSLYQGPNGSLAGMAFKSYNVYGKRSGYLREWVYLPEGLIFVPNEAKFGTGDPSDTYNVFVLKTDAAQTNRRTSADIAWPSTGATQTMQMVAIGFKPDGSLFAGNGSSDFEIYVTEGWNSSTSSPPDYSVQPGVGNRQLMSVDVYGISGQFKIRDYGAK